MYLTLLLTVFRMVVLPVEFQDRQFATSREEQEALVQRAQDYFNRQFDGEELSFEFVLGPGVTLSHGLAYYGANYSDRKDIRIQDAVREACNKLKDEIDFASFDNDGDGAVDNVFLLTAGPGEQDGGDENDIWPQQGRLSATGSVLSIKGKRIDSFAASSEMSAGYFCHEFGHVLGLVDFYDTDGAGSGGQTPGLWRTSLMDDGCRLPEIPDFGAPEFDMLGLGTCDPLLPGHYELAPLPEGRRYLKAPTDREGEWFLFGCGPGGLYVYHLDRSDNAAGYSQRHDTELSARERWEHGAVNDAPEHPCLRLLPADPDASDAARVAFPQAGFDSFGSDTPSAFRSWSGRASGLALTDIRLLPDGGVAFEVVEPLRLSDISVYQDAAVVRWELDPALAGVLGYEVSWTDGEETFSQELGAAARSCTLEGLRPQTGYRFSVQVRTSERDRYSVGGSFVTKVYRGGTYPYIYLNNVPRSSDGSFPPGSKIPLRVFNATEVQEVRWSLNGHPIQPEADGNFTLTRSGTLKAEIIHTDGSTETIIKEINVL
jgi:M6 family metalloprotease-like protein